jgi:lactoylglutathione lyase
VTDYALSVVRIFVTDWARAVRFYTETVGIPAVVRDDAMGWARLDTGPGQLALERVQPGDDGGRALVGRFVGVSLAMPDVELAYRRLRDRGMEFPGPPERQPWGGVRAHFRDPDGNVITLVGRPS